MSFLKIDYIYDIYIEKSILDSILPRIQFSIPPAGFLTNVLLQFELNWLDNEIAQSCPHLNVHYHRHIHEVYISNCSSAREISSIFSKLGLEGVIYYIKPGGLTNCFVGQIGVTKKGKIIVQYA